jgi:hypothetical protein
MAAPGDRAAAAGRLLRLVLAALPGLLGLLLLAYGAWLAWQPAGFMTAGVLLLADRVASRWPQEGAEPS